MNTYYGGAAGTGRRKAGRAGAGGGAETIGVLSGTKAV